MLKIMSLLMVFAGLLNMLSTETCALYMIAAGVFSLAAVVEDKK